MRTITNQPSPTEANASLSRIRTSISSESTPRVRRVPATNARAAGAPNAITDPDYKLPDDGLDPTARKMFATQVATIIAGVTLLAILSNFKI